MVSGELVTAAVIVGVAGICLGGAALCFALWVAHRAMSLTEVLTRRVSVLSAALHSRESSTAVLQAEMTPAPPMPEAPSITVEMLRQEDI